MSRQLFQNRKINRSTPIPYYYQIVQILREALRDADVSAGEGDLTLPSEAEFCDIFEVNRGTVRHALQVLEREGLIYREKGRGTFFRRKRLEVDLTVLCSTTEDMKARGWKPGTKVITLSKEIPSLHIQHSLALPPEEMVWSLYRLRLANGEPTGLERSFLPCRLYPDLEGQDLNTSLYYILRNVYGMHPSRADQLIRTRGATSEEAGYLAIQEQESVFEISRCTFDPTGEALEYLESVWRGDRYDFHVRLFSRE